jgi:glycosyltransferase involved in cell wall biosynthesis
VTASVAIVAARPRGAVDGIWDHSVRLTAAVRERPDATARLYAFGRGAEWERSAQAPLVTALPADADAVVLQYNPFSFARWGFAQWLAGRLWQLRSRPHRPVIGLMVHEPYVPMTSWRWTVMGAWQRGQLLALRAAADVVLVAVERWSGGLAPARPRRPTHHVPVGSALPDMRPARQEQRGRLGLAGDTVVLAAFGTSHPTRLTSFVERGALAVARAGHAVAVLNLGAGAPALPRLDGRVAVLTPGPLGSAELGRWLAAADIFLAPFLDGVSTRRTTLMAALQHALPVVATDGPLTDSVLRDAPEALRLVPVDDEPGFAAAVVGLADDPAARGALSRGARALHDRSFAWPRIAGRTLDALGLSRVGSSPQPARRVL